MNGPRDLAGLGRRTSGEARWSASTQLPGGVSAERAVPVPVASLVLVRPRVPGAEDRGGRERSESGSAATAPARELMLTTVTTATPSAGSVHLVVGYDGSPPASRALDAAVRLLQGRTGRIDVVYVAHLSSLAMLSPGAIAEMESDFDEIAQQLRATAAEQLAGGAAAWGFERRQGMVPQELIAVATAIGEAGPGNTVAIVVGSSSHATHRVVGSVAVSLARHSPVPLVIVP